MDPTGSLDAKFAEENEWNIYQNKMIMMSPILPIRRCLRPSNVPLLEGSTHKQRATFYFKTRVKIGQGGPQVGKQKRKKGPAL